MLLSAAAAVLSAVSLYHYVLQAAQLQVGPSFCNINNAFNCDAVNASRFATIFGVPVASYGAVFYLLLLAVAWNLEGKGGKATDVLVFLSTFALAFSIYLFLVSKLVIGVLCPTCLALYGLNLLIFLSALARERDSGLPGSLRSGAAALLVYPARLVRGASDRLTALLYGLPLLAVAVAVTLVPQAVISASERRASVSPLTPLEQWRAERAVDLSKYVTPSGADADYSMGPADAPVTIFEFSDFECPGCRKFYQFVETLAEERPGKIRLIYKNYPLDSSCNPAIRGRFHESSCVAVGYSRCAGEQGRFWEMVGLIFSGIEVSEASLEMGAESLGLDRDALGECLASERLRRKISSDLEDAEKLGVRGTPSIWINGKRLARFSPELVRAIVDELSGEREG